MFGGFRSIQSYLDWQASPVLTTVNTTAYPVKMIEFPAVTICGQGMSDDIISAAMFKQFFEFFAKKNITVPVNPFRAQELIYIKVPIHCHNYLLTCFIKKIQK